MYRLLGFIFLSLLTLIPQLSGAQTRLFGGAATQLVLSLTSFGAVCNGVTNDAAAFASFGQYAIANQGTLQVVLNLPSSATCLFNPNVSQARWLQGPFDNISSVATGGGCTGGGSTCVRITISSTTGFNTGEKADIFGAEGTPLANGAQTITVVDATHIDLPNVTFVANTKGALCRITSQQGVKNLLVKGNGSTIKTTSGTPLWGTGGINQDAYHSARTATVSAGVSAVTLSDATKSSLFTAGTYAIMTGFDLQGIWGAAYGYPPNLNFFEYVYITNVNSITGVITFAAPLNNTYKSTWPNYNSGTYFNVDSAGPATLFYLNPNWNTTIEYQNITIDNAAVQSIANGRNVALRNAVTLGSLCWVPSQNQVWQLISVNSSTCNIEVDKLITQMIITSSTMNHLKFQSSSVDSLVMTNSTTLIDLVGTPKSATISNSSLGTFSVGSFAYGATVGAVSCSTCTITSLSGNKQFSVSNAGNYFSMSSGVLSYPNGTNITNVTNNGSNHPRLTVDSTTGFFTGQTANIGGVTGFASGVNQDNAVLTIVNGTTFDLLNQTLGVGSYVSGGIVGLYAPSWAVPGGVVFWGGRITAETSFTIVDVTQTLSGCAGSGCTSIQTSLGGGFPTIPLSVSGQISLGPSSTPNFTCTNCTGSATAVDLSQVGAQGKPFNVYTSRTYTCAANQANVANSLDINSAPSAQPSVWGGTSTLTVNVTTADTSGGSKPWNFMGSGGGLYTKQDGTIGQYNPVVNVAVSGTRTMTPATTTCSSGGASCSGDTLINTSDVLAFGSSYVPLSAFVTNNASTCPVVTVTIQATQ